MATIDVERTSSEGAGRFRVTVSEASSESAHVVDVSQAYYEELTGGAVSAEELVSESFAFLLEREPKESILREFDLTVISRYFSEYEDEIRERLGESG